MKKKMKEGHRIYETQPVIYLLFVFTIIVCTLKIKKKKYHEIEIKWKCSYKCHNKIDDIDYFLDCYGLVLGVPRLLFFFSL